MWKGDRLKQKRSFAEGANLRSQNIAYRLKVVDTPEKVVQSKIYEFDVVDNNGIATTIWAFGIDEIMPPPDSVDLSVIRDLFPHVPDKAFELSKNKNVDILSLKTTHRYESRDSGE